jgi:hypothetical protein
MNIIMLSFFLKGYFKKSNTKILGPFQGGETAVWREMRDRLAVILQRGRRRQQRRKKKGKGKKKVRDNDIIMIFLEELIFYRKYETDMPQSTSYY